MFKKFSALLLLLTAFASKLSATAYVDEMPIYLEGDTQIFADIFNSIAMVLGSPEVESLLQLLAFVAILVAAYQALNHRLGQLVMTLIFLAIGIASLSVDSLKVKVHIHDVRADYGTVQYGGSSYSTVDHVPYFIGLTASLTTSVVSGLNKLIDSGFSTVEGSGTSRWGFMGGMNTFKTINKAVNPDVNETTYAYKTKVVTYVSECYMYEVENNSSLMRNLISPEKSLIDVIAPVGAGGMAVEVDGANTTCQDLYNTLKTDFGTYADVLYNQVDKALGKISLDKYDSDISNLYLSKVYSDIGNSVSSTRNYIANIPFQKMVSMGLRNTTIGQQLSGQDTAHFVTVESSKANLQQEGAGQWRWVVEVMPYYVHFMRGIIYAASVFTLLFMIAVGWERAKMLALAYGAGLATFEVTVVSMTLVNAIINRIISVEAPDRIGEAGNVAMGLKNYEYLDYMATMEGIAGTLGLSAIFIVPGIIIAGKVSAATSALGSMAGQYKGNSIDNTRQDSTRESATKRAIGNMTDEQRDFLKKHGIAAPQGTGDLEYAAQVMASMDTASKGLGQLSAQSRIDDYGRGGYNRTVEASGQTAGAGNSKETTNDILEASANSGVIKFDSGIAGGKGLDEAGAINADGSSNTDYVAEMVQQSKEGAASTINSGANLKNLSPAERKEFAKNKKKEAESYTEKAKDFEQEAEQAEAEMEEEAKTGKGKRWKAAKQRAESRRSKAQEFRDLANEKTQEAEDIENNKNFNPLGSETRTKAAVSSSLDALMKKTAAGIAIEKQGVVDVAEDGTVKANAQAFKGHENMADTSAANTKQMGKMTTGQAVASGKKGADDKIAAAEGAIRSQVYDDKGSDEGKNAHEHDKYMRGNTLLERKKINDSALSAGSAEASVSEGEKRQMMADQQVAKGGALLDEMSKSKGARKVYGVGHDEDGYIDEVDNKSGVSYKDADGKSHRISKAKAMELSGEAEQMQQIGKGAGISKNTDGGKNMDMYASNAQYSEMSQQQTTAAKIKTQEGIDKAVAADVIDSSLKAKKQVSGQEAEIKTLAKSSGVDANKAKEDLGTAGKKFGEEAAKVLENAGKVAGGNMALRTAGDIKNVDAAQSSNLLDKKDSGKVTDVGMTAKGIEAQERMAPLEQKVKNFTPEQAKKLEGEMVDALAAHQLGTNREGLEKMKNSSDPILRNQAKGAIDSSKAELQKEGFYGEDGQTPVSGEKLAGWIAAKGAGNKAGMHSLAVAGKNVGLSLGQDKVRVSSVDSGTSLSDKDTYTDDSSKSISEGTIYKSNATYDTLKNQVFNGSDEKTQDFLKQQQTTKEVYNNSGTGLLTFASGVMLDALGLERNPENMSNAALAVTAGVGVAGIEAAGSLRNWVQDKTEAVKASKGELSGLKRDDQGNYLDKDGKKFADSKENKLDADGQQVRRVKKGPVWEGGRKVVSKVRKTVGGSGDLSSEAVNQTQEDTKDDGTNKEATDKQSHPDDKVNKSDSGEHGTSPGNSNSDSNITPISDTVKPASQKLQNQQDALYEKMVDIESYDSKQFARNELISQIDGKLDNEKLSPEQTKNLKTLRNRLEYPNDTKISPKALEKAGLDTKDIVPTSTTNTNGKAISVVDFEGSGSVMQKRAADAVYEKAEAMNPEIEEMKRAEAAVKNPQTQNKPASAVESSQGTLRTKQQALQKAKSSLGVAQNTPAEEFGKEKFNQFIENASDGATPEQRMALQRLKESAENGQSLSTEALRAAGIEKETLSNNGIKLEADDALDAQKTGAPVKEEAVNKAQSDVTSAQTDVNAAKENVELAKKIDFPAGHNEALSVAQSKVDNPMTISPKNNMPSGTVLDAPAPKKPKVGGGKYGLAIGTLLGGSSVALMADELDKKVEDGDYAGATLDVAEVFDPTISGVQTAREQGEKISNNIGQGDYAGAAKNVVETPAIFAKNIVDSGKGLGYTAHAAFDKYVSGNDGSQSVLDDMPSSDNSGGNSPAHANTSSPAPTSSSTPKNSTPDVKQEKAAVPQGDVSATNHTSSEQTQQTVDSPAQQPVAPNQKVSTQAQTEHDNKQQVATGQSATPTQDTAKQEKSQQEKTMQDSTDQRTASVSDSQGPNTPVFSQAPQQNAPTAQNIAPDQQTPVSNQGHSGMTPLGAAAVVAGAHATNTGDKGGVEINNESIQTLKKEMGEAGRDFAQVVKNELGQGGGAPTGTPGAETAPTSQAGQPVVNTARSAGGSAATLSTPVSASGSTANHAVNNEAPSVEQSDSDETAKFNQRVEGSQTFSQMNEGIESVGSQTQEAQRRSEMNFQNTISQVEETNMSIGESVEMTEEIHEIMTENKDELENLKETLKDMV